MDYANGLETKNNIFNAAKKLFYENGYVKTTFANICKEANVNPGSVSYHYGTKIQLAAEVRKGYGMVIAENIETFFPDANVLLKQLLRLSVTMYLLYNFEKYRRFVVEFDAARIPMNSDLEDERLYGMGLFVGTNMSKKQADFYMGAFRGMNGTIEAYIDTHHDELTIEEIISYSARVYYFYVDKDILSKEIDNAIEKLKSIDIKESYFELSISLKEE